MINSKFNLGIVLILVGILASSSFTISCSFSCGTFGSGSTTFGTFEQLSLFEPIVVGVGDTIIYRPAKHYRILYENNGTGNCSEESYYSGGHAFRITSNADSLATFQSFYAYHNLYYGNSELQLRVIGKQQGQTTINLEIQYTADDMHYSVHAESFDVELIVN